MSENHCPKCGSKKSCECSAPDFGDEEEALLTNPTEHKPCDCGYNRWKTINKNYDQFYNREYQCRKCNKVRTIRRIDDVESGRVI